MAENTFTLNVELQTNTANAGLQNLQKELKSTADAAKNASKGFGEGFGKLDSGVKNLTGSLRGLATGGIGGVTQSIGALTSGMGLAVGAFTSIGLAAVGVTAALIANGIAMATMADEAAEMAEKMGLSITELETFKLIADENGTSVEALVRTYDKLSDSLTKVADGNIDTENAFRRLGLAQSDLAKLSKEQIAEQVIKNWEALGRTAKATAAAQDILGKGFRDQIPAIKEAGIAYEEYQKRVLQFGAVVTPELVKAGGEQEKAFNNVKLAATGLQIELARSFAKMATDAANWLADMLNSIRGVAAGFREVREAAAQVEAIPQSRRNELLSQARRDTESEALSGGAEFTEGAVNKRFKELLAAEVKARVEMEQDAARELARFKRQVEAIQSGTASGVKELADKLKDPKLTFDTLFQKGTEQQEFMRNWNSGIKLLNNELKELQANIDAGSNTTDNATLDMLDLADAMVRASKGVISVGEAFAMVEKSQKEFITSDIVTNTRNFNKAVKDLNTDYEIQFKILSATTDKQKELVQVRAALTKPFEGQKGGMTPEQAAELAKALEKAGDQFDRIRNQKISNSVKDSMRDLTEQSRDLAFEIDHFWDANAEGLINTNAALQSLYRQIDPEGRGANLSEQQKADLQRQLEFIEGQKRLLEQNKMIEESFHDLGSAVTAWVLDSENGIKRVKLELIKLIALSALRAAGTTGNSFADVFIGGMVSGLSGSRASGGPVQAGSSYRVGEKGAETVTFGRNGYVMPKEQMSVSSKTGGLTVSVNPKFENHGTINSTEDLEGYMQQWGEGVARHTEKFVREQFSSTGMAYMR